MTDSKQLLIIGFVWPEPASSAAGLRMLQLIDLFRSDGWRITFASAASKSDYAESLEPLGVRCRKIEINSSGFDDFVRKLQPDAVLYDRFITEEQFGWRVEKYVPEAIRILDTEDLHCLRRVRRNALEQQVPFNSSRLLASEIARREVASILRCDLTLIISEFEMKLLQDLFGVDEDLLMYLPLFKEEVTGRERASWPDFEERSHFMTIGNFSHPPNADSVAYLRNEIWPAIRQELPDAEMLVYGAYPGRQALQWHSDDLGFHIRGRVEDSGKAMRSARVCLAPLRFGAGLKGKLLEAMQNGTPSVTTPVGAEGIQGELPWNGAIAESKKDLISAGIALYRDKKRWDKAQERGAAIINSRFRRELFDELFYKRLQDLAGNLEEHRLQNFTGSMLRHHSMASTEYMSRWIEAKNKIKEDNKL